MGDCLLLKFNFAKLHFDQSNIYTRNFKIIYARNFFFAVFDDELTKRTCR